MMNGIFLIDKPAGMTSHDVVYKIRKKFHIKKVGHTGTLDPFATGLLIVLVGKATKLAFLFEDLDKSYTGELVFGKAYDTDDMTGRVIAESNKLVDEKALENVVQSMIPTYAQVPPNYSAIKKDGIKAYEAARKGIDLHLKARNVFVYHFNYTLNNHGLYFDTKVSKGTYIRSIARDIGLSLNTYGALRQLNRTMIGIYNIQQAKTIEEVTYDDLIDHEVLFIDTPKVVLEDYFIKLVLNGTYLDHRQTTLEVPFVVTDKQGKYIAYYLPDNGQYKVKYFF